MRNGQTGVTLYGVDMTVSANLTLGTLQFSNTNGGANGYFSNGKLYVSTSGTRATATLVSGASIAINGSDITVTGFSQAMVTGTTYTYYLDVDVSITYGSLPSTIQFATAFVKGPGYYPTYTQSGLATGAVTYSLVKPDVTVTNLTGGLTTGTLVYGQTGIAIFGFSVTVTGALTANKFTIASANNAQSLFGNAKLWRSTTSTTYPTGFTQVATGTVNSGQTQFTYTETFPGAATTVNYFVTVDYSGQCPTASTIGYTISPGQSTSFIIGPSSVDYPSSTTVTGTVYNVAKTLNWVGGQAGGLWSNMSNFATICGGAPSSIGAYDVVQIGVSSSYTSYNQPVLTGNTTVGQIIFGKYGSPILTMGLFSLNSGISTSAVGTGSSPTIIGAAQTITIPSGAVATITAGTTLSSTASISNSTNMTVGSGATLTLTGTAALTNASGGDIDNAGTISVLAASTNAGTIDLSGTGAITCSTTLSNSNSISGTGSGSITVGGTLTNTGTISQTGTGGMTFAAITNTGGTITNGSTAAMSVSGAVSNTGTISKTNTGTVTFNAAVTNSSGGSIVQNGSSGLLTFSNTLSNTGTVSQTNTGGITFTGNVTNNSGGSISQTAAGPIIFTGDLTNSSGATLTLGSGSTTLNGTGTNTNSGTITAGAGALDINAPTFTNNGTLTLAGGATTIASTTFNQGSAATFTAGTGTLNFDGAAQSINNANTTTPIAFGNVTFSGSGTKTLNSTGTGLFQIASTGTLTVSSPVTLACGTNLLTLKSDATATASLDKITGTAAITGTVTAERYIPAGNRGYRILSSPVWSITGSSPYSGLKSYDLNYMKLYTLITGPVPASNGFTTSTLNNPSVFAYNETLTTPVTNNISTSDYKGFASTSEYMPIGNGVLFFYRGNQNITKTGGSGNAFTSPYPTPEATTLINTGTIPTGTITVNRPVFPASSTYYNVKNTAAGSPGPQITGSSTSLSYTVTSLPGTDGFNMLGNPYPSTIDLEALVYNTDFAGLSGNSTATFYTLNPANTNGFGTYTRSGTGATGTALNGGSRYVLSGEGFFVKAASTSAYFKFTEASKTTYPSSGNTPSVFGLKEKNPAVKIKLIQDATYYNETLLTFNKDNKSTFTEDEDVAYLAAPSQQVFMYSSSDEGTSCVINRLPALENIKPIKLYAEGAVTGTYTMEFSNVNTIDSRYRIFLKDSFKKDSLDVTNNTTYSFNIDRANTTTYGANRFTLVVYKDNNAAYKLVSFTGSKQQGTSVLTWTVQNESDVYTFDLERSTDGGKTYSTIGTIQADRRGTYSVTDTKPVYGDNLYRLKQDDVNDAITYSDIVKLTYDTPQVAGTSINVYPNPTSDKIKIDFTQTIVNPLEVHLVNTNGRVIKKSIFSATQHIEEEVGSLMTGTYVVDVYDKVSNKKISSSKFIKI
ncbi:hypothetical protein GCM10028826_32240 [Mucilaginibacter boryungensis]